MTYINTIPQEIPLSYCSQDHEPNTMYAPFTTRTRLTYWCTHYNQYCTPHARGPQHVNPLPAKFLRM